MYRHTRNMSIHVHVRVYLCRFTCNFSKFVCWGKELIATEVVVTCMFLHELLHYQPSQHWDQLHSSVELIAWHQEGCEQSWSGRWEVLTSASCHEPIINTNGWYYVPLSHYYATSFDALPSPPPKKNKTNYKTTMKQKGFIVDYWVQVTGKVTSVRAKLPHCDTWMCVVWCLNAGIVTAEYLCTCSWVHNEYVNSGRFKPHQEAINHEYNNILTQTQTKNALTLCITWACALWHRKMYTKSCVTLPVSCIVNKYCT